MKRNVIAALIIGLIVGGLVVGLEMSGWLLRPEHAVSGLLPETTTRLMAAVQDAIAFVAAAGVAFLTLAASRRGRMGFIVAILLVELLGVAWVCSLYKLEFQPLPAIAAALLAFLGAIAFVLFAAYLEERRSRPPKISAGLPPREAPISVVPDVPTPVPVAMLQPVA